MPSRSLASFPGLSHICTRHASEPKALSLPLRHEIKAPSLSVAKPVKTNGPPLSFSTVSRSVPNVIPAYRQRLCGPCTRTHLGFCFGSSTFQNISILASESFGNNTVPHCIRPQLRLPRFALSHHFRHR